MIISTTTSIFWWFISLVRYKSNWINQSSSIKLNLSYPFTFWNYPSGLLSTLISPITKYWRKNYIYNVTHLKLNTQKKCIWIYINFGHFICYWCEFTPIEEVPLCQTTKNICYSCLIICWFWSRLIRSGQSTSSIFTIAIQSSEKFSCSTVKVKCGIWVKLK